MTKRSSTGANKQIKDMQKELGGSGTSLLRGFLREDYKSELRFPQSVLVYEKMLKGDAQVKASIKACQLPIMAAKWFIPAKDQEDDIKLKEAGEFVHQALFERIDFESFLYQALGMLPYGYSLFEKVFTVEDGKIWWEKFAWRKQYSVYKWETQDGEPGITQNLSEQGGGMVSIPAWKMILFSNEKEGDNFAGVSILRSAYKHWYMKDTFYKIDAIAFERNGIGILKITLPEGHLPDDKTKAEELGENFYANEQQYIVLPNKEWEAELLGGATNLRDPKDSIQHHNREITKNVLAQFLELGTGEKGSFALSENHSSLFYLSLEAIAKNICATMNEVIRELCELNGYELEEYPTLEFSHIGVVDFGKMADALSSLATGGFLKPDNPTEAHIRNILQLPEADEETAREKEEPVKPEPPEEVKEEIKKEKPKEKKEVKKKEEKVAKVKEKKEMTKKIEVNKFDDKALEQMIYDVGEVEPSFKEMEFKPYRKLYDAEKRVNYKQFVEFFNSSVVNFEAESLKMLNEMIAEMIKKAKKAVEDKKVRDIGKLSLKHIAAYKAFLKAAYKKSYDFGKNSASDELSVDAPKTPQERIAQMNMTADAVVEKQARDIELVAKTTILDGMSREQATKAILFAALLAANKKANIVNRGNANIAVIGQLTYGRTDVFGAHMDKIQKFQYSAVMDNRTTDWCASLDGRVVDSDSPEYDTYIPGQHFNCRSIWVAILNDDRNPPRSEKIGDDIPQQTGGVDNFKDLKKTKPYTPKPEEPKKATETKKPEKKTDFDTLVKSFKKILDDES